MKTDEQIIELFQRKQFDGVRYACIERLKNDRIDGQAWISLGQAMSGLKRWKMARLCFQRALFLDPFASWENDMLRDIQTVELGRDDNQVLKLLEVPKATVSALILTRDSSRTIRQCIEALHGAVDEIVVVDTGSTDDTIAIVESFGIPVHHFAWCDDFSAARNYALSLVTSEWVIAIDSDEILYSEDKESIHIAAGLFNTPGLIVSVLIMNSFNGRIMSSNFITRMFKASAFRWKYPIHEQYVNLDPDEDLSTCTLRIRLSHDGYDASLVNQIEKNERNIQLIKKVIQDEPNNALFRYFLGREHLNINKYEEGINHLKDSLQIALDNLLHNPSLANPFPDISVFLYKSYKKFGQREEAKNVICQLVEYFPDYPDGWFYHGVEIIESPPYDVHKAIDIFTTAQKTAELYRGPSQFDPEIGTKALAYLERLTTIETN